MNVISLELFNRSVRFYAKIGKLGLSFSKPSDNSWVVTNWYNGFDFHFLCFKGSLLWRKSCSKSSS